MKKITGLLGLLALASVASSAPVTYRVTQSVGSLSLGQPAINDPYLFLDFQLTDGKNVGNGDSTVAISGLSLSGGTIDYDNRLLPDIGNVSGTGSAFTLRDGLGASNAFADRAVLFRVTSATAVLSYNFTLDSTAIDMPTPDGFNAAFLYRTGTGQNDVNVVQTLGPTGNEMVNYSFNGGAATVPMAYAVDPAFAAERATVGDNRFAALGAPVITRPVPEPAALLPLGLGALAFLRRRRK